MKAFPKQDTELVDGSFIPQAGMDLRDYFAAQAIQAVVNCWYQDLEEDGEGFTLTSLEDGKSPSTESELIALDCYAIADAMMKERANRD